MNFLNQKQRMLEQMELDRVAHREQMDKMFVDHQRSLVRLAIVGVILTFLATFATAYAIRLLRDSPQRSVPATIPTTDS